MKIIYINSLDKRYGSTYRSRNIVKALIELGHEVKYVESNLEENIFENSVSITQKDNIFGYFVATCKRASLVFQSNFDILYIQKFIPLTALCLIAGKLKGKTCIVDWDDLDWALQGTIIKKILVYICEFVFPYFADIVTTHSFLLKQYAQKMCIRNVYIVNQIVDFDNSVVSEEEKARIRNKYNLEGKKVLGYLCTLTEGGSRDIDVIIKWVSELIKKDNSFFLFIIGGGPLENKVKALLCVHNLQLDKNVAITGIVPHNEIFNLLSLSEVGLIYMRETLGNKFRMSFKAIEYLMMDLLVVGKVAGETHKRLSHYIYSLDLADIPSIAEINVSDSEKRKELRPFPKDEYCFATLVRDLRLIF